MSRVPIAAVLHIFMALFLMLAIPFYLGLVHWSLGQFLLYCGAAGLGLAAGDYLTTDPALRSGLRFLVSDAALRSIALTLLGGFIYLLAWLF